MRWDLLKSIVWLRWRLSRNQLRKSGKFMRVFLIVLTVLAVGAVFGVMIGGFVAGRVPLSRASPVVVMYVVDAVVVGFLFFWLIGILAEIQRSESIDLGKLLHLPVTLKDAFIVNFVASHVNLVVALVGPLMIGLSAGLALGSNPRFLVLLPLFFSFLFLISAWTYYLRGWLVQLMENPRRRRTIVITLTFAVVLAGQLPNLFFNVFNRRALHGGANQGQAMEERMEQMKGVMEELHLVLPPFWVGLGTRRAAEGTWWPALGAAALCLAGGSVGLSRAYRSTLRFYRGAGRGKAVKIRRQPETEVSIKRPLEGRLPFVPDNVAGAALAFLRSLLRAPELKMALLGPVLMVGVLVVVLMGRNLGAGFHRAAPLAAIGMTVFSFTGILQIAFNQFGWDRTGFRALVLLPTARRSILLAKNIAAGMLMVSLGMLVYAAIALFLGVGWIELFAGWLQVVSAVVLLCTIGNYLSIVLPVRISAGSLRPTKMPIVTALVMMLLALLLPLYMIPVFLGPGLGLLASLALSGWGALINLAVSAGVLLLLAILYSLSLKPLGRLFWEREQKILHTVTLEVE